MKILKFDSRIFFVLTLSLFFYQFKNKEPHTVSKFLQEPVRSERANQHLLQSVLWFQTSGELMALFFQTYNLATLRFDEKLEGWKKLSSPNKKSRPAVIVDVDETIIDNSPYEGYLLQKNINYSSWTDWVKESKAEALPGALEFLKHVKSRGAEIFYLSNRKAGEQKEATRINLHNLGFPNTEDTLFMSFNGYESSKKSRRSEIAKKYEILLLCGDNLSDFTELFDNRDKDTKKEIVKEYRKEFGDKFIILPNPMYGDWEKNIWNGFKLSLMSPASKDSARYSHINKGR